MVISFFRKSKKYWFKNSYINNIKKYQILNITDKIISIFTQLLEDLNRLRERRVNKNQNLLGAINLCMFL
jgi:hypothetical protein